MNKKRLLVIGGGASGYMGAITAAETNPHLEIFILEKSRQTLAKVKISGGGRCNVCNATEQIPVLLKAYPRGGSFLKTIFKQFATKDTFTWFESRNVPLKIEPDGRVFPLSNSSETVVDCLEKSAKKLGIKVFYSSGVKKIVFENQQIKGVLLSDETFLDADYLLATTGGGPQLNSYDWLSDTGHAIVPPVPSLFTFNAPHSLLLSLPGLSVNNVTVRISGTKLQNSGAFLITHWGFSGPAVLVLSAKAARELANKTYDFSILIDFTGGLGEKHLRETFDEWRKIHSKKQIHSHPQFQLPQRLWSLLCDQAQISKEQKWEDVSAKMTNKLVENLLNYSEKIAGKTTFKDEFVTCGGVDLKQIMPDTMESKRIKNLFFAGELIDIDAVTGGYNFQAAWSTGYVAGKNIGNGV
ncbi:MAG: NAD(P)/FAD-dependent oxidoreductase [Pseudarcicella sp.]|nr:NAD(P)/FAD-dependent oxidoreductase [Pseudarcicella sp.]